MRAAITAVQYMKGGGNYKIFSPQTNNMPNGMKVYAITIEDAHGEYGRLYALADNDSDKLRLEKWPRQETMGDDTAKSVSGDRTQYP